jgi:hypothetical protein
MLAFSASGFVCNKIGEWVTVGGEALTRVESLQAL